MSRYLYGSGVAVSWVLIFVGAWAYFILTEGPFWGVGLGWLPAAIIASVLCWLWPAGPLVALILLILLILPVAA